MKGRITPVGVVVLAGLVAGILLLILGSTTVVQVIGAVIILCAILLVLAGQTGSSRLAAYARPQMDHDISMMAPGPVSEPAPEYIEEAPDAPESVWEHEGELYREKEQRERRGEPS
jgi:hypothetical protein